MALKIIAVIVGAICWLVQLIVLIKSVGSPRELAIGTFLGLSFMIMVLSLALGLGV